MFDYRGLNDMLFLLFYIGVGCPGWDLEESIIFLSMTNNY
jgi:hypothetical protein